MSLNIIEVENLSKKYKLGEYNTGTLSLDLTNWWSRSVLKKNNSETTKQGEVWSLKDVSFSVQAGEVFGIIGKNGAGKSTLLKLLSKITKPTGGSIKIDGRISSLLEVGTGFHPDLSGRENIFLNGAILGMRKQEIKSKFDEIVDFSGIEKYIDTPVKRYSSGMFVRLAFAVAAHLEPEILIIDEVLAVGDAEFQQKCIGKMQDVANKKGRTILFVSHNNTAVKRLCNKALLLEKGMVKMIDTAEKVLGSYQLAQNDAENGKRNHYEQQGTEGYFMEWKLEGSRSQDDFSCYSNEHVRLLVKFHAIQNINACSFHLMIRDDDDNNLLHVSSKDFGGRNFNLQPGVYNLKMELSLPVNHGQYKIELGMLKNDKDFVDHWKTTTRLFILDTFDQHHLGAPGIINIKTNFYYENSQSLLPQYPL